MTESEDEADEAYTEWHNARVHAHKDPKGPISLDGIGIAYAIGELFGKKDDVSK